MVSWLPAVSRPSPTRARRLRYGDVSSQTLSFQRVSGVGHQDCSGFLPGEREERREEGKKEQGKEERERGEGSRKGKEERGGGEGRRGEEGRNEGGKEEGRRKRRGERNPCIVDHTEVISQLTVRFN